MKEVVDSGNLKVLYANYDYFLDKISKNEQFNYTRIQHAIPDVLIESYSDINNLIDDIKFEKWDKIAQQVIDKEHGVLKFWHNVDIPIADKFELAYKIIYENNSLIPNLHLGVSAGIGFGMNGHGNLHETHPMQKKRSLILQLMTQKSQKIFHGGLPRHMSVMGETFDFFNKLNEMDVDVVIYGPMYMKEYANVFKINRFHHLPISPKGAIGEVDTIIPMLIEYCSKLNNPLILNCTGHIISLLLAYELRNTNISNFDIGLGFNWYIKDYLKNNHPEINNPWIRQPDHLLRRYISEIRN
jgi:hypothetical protein